MIKSMTGFGRFEIKEEGIRVSAEIKSLNGRFTDINCKLSKSIQNKELEIRELIRNNIIRGSIHISINVEVEDISKQIVFNEPAAVEFYQKLNSLRTKLKLREAVNMTHLLQFSSYFFDKNAEEDTDNHWKLTIKAINEALKALDKMKKIEGQKLMKDMQTRLKKIKDAVVKIEALGIDRIPEERNKLRQRISLLFESDEIDEQRLQMEIVLLADKLDISEECVRLNSHIKYFNEVFKEKEPSGRKINFLLQEMHREINTIGSKANDAQISQVVVEVKEEIERIREQIQNIE